MSDQRAEPFDPAEARLAVRMHAWTDQGVIAIDATDIAMRAASVRGATRTRRLGTLASLWDGRMGLRLAAVFVLVALAMAVAIVGSAMLRRTSPPEIYRAVVLRQGIEGVDVFVAGADGSERLIRRLTSVGLGLDPQDTLQPYGGVSRQGWLELVLSSAHAPDSHETLPYGLSVLVDLADPARAPIIEPGNGFMIGRWGPDGRWAHFCGEASDCYRSGGSDDGQITGSVKVIDPNGGAGTAVVVHDVQTFGSNPEMVWTADGSGFLGRTETGWGVTPIDGGPFVPGIPRLQSRWLDLKLPGFNDPTNRTQQQYVMRSSELAPATPVRAQLAADGNGIWQLLDATRGPAPRALLAKLTGAGDLDSVHAFNVPFGPVSGVAFSPDDATVAIYVGDGDQPGFILAPVGPGDVTTTGPVINGSLVGLVPASAADAWPGE